MVNTNSMTVTDERLSPINDQVTYDNACLPIAERTSRQDSLQATVTLVKLGLRTNLQWLERDEPNVDAAIGTIHRLLEQVSKLEKEVRQLA